MPAGLRINKAGLAAPNQTNSEERKARKKKRAKMKL
jgi:hypothetical protein